MSRPPFARAAASIVVVLLSVGLLPSTVLAADPVPPEPVSITVNTTADAVSGSLFAFEPVYPDGFVIPEDAICQWELSWGDDDSLFQNFWNDTYGMVLIRGIPAAGYCDGWEFTLPYSLAGQWQWDYTITDRDFNPLINAILPGDVGRPVFTGINNSPEWSGVTESTLPGVWLSMTRHATIGSTMEVVAHPFGGYSVPAGGASFAAHAPGDDSEHYVQEGQSLTFSFVPQTGGNWAAFYNDTGYPNAASAGVDPEVGPRVPTATPVPSQPPAATTPTAKPNVTVPPTDSGALVTATSTAPSVIPTVLVVLLAGLLVMSAASMRRRS